MKLKRTILAFALVVMGTCIHPLSVFADKCDDEAHKASAIFDKAKAASERQDYENAAKLYEKAGLYYKKVSKMKNCSCPTIEETAIASVEICNNNAKRSREALSEYEEVTAYNEATILFNKGNDQARKQQWDEAVRSFEQAEMIWRGIDLTSTTGQQALQAANEASTLAERARQQM